MILRQTSLAHDMQQTVGFYAFAALSLFLLCDLVCQHVIQVRYSCWLGQQWYHGLGCPDLHASWTWRTLLPARWVGHQRRRMVTRRRGRVVDVGGAYREGLTWHPRRSAQQQGKWQLFANDPVGAARAVPKASSQRRTVVGAFPGGRRWRFIARPGQYWGQFVEDAARIMDVDPMLFETWCDGAQVDQSAQMPRTVEEVNFIWVGPQPVSSSPERRQDGSRRRRRSRSHSSMSSEVEPSTIYFEYQVGEGFWGTFHYICRT